MTGAGIDRVLHDPVSDKLEPLVPLDVTQIHSIDDMVRAMAHRVHRTPGGRRRRRAGSDGAR